VLIEYTTLSDARAAIDGANGTKLLDQELSVDYAFVRPPPGGGGGKQQGGQGAKREQLQRGRSRSPGARGEGRDDE